MVPIGTVPSSYFNDAPRFTAIIDLLPEIDHGSVVKAGLWWSLALMPCITLVARLASRLLYFLFGVAMRGLVALVPPVPEASFKGAIDQCSVTMALRSRGQVPSGRHLMLPIELHERALGQPLYLGVGC
jgi:hypothetical protein